MQTIQTGPTVILAINHYVKLANITGNGVVNSINKF